MVEVRQVAYEGPHVEPVCEYCDATPALYRKVFDEVLCRDCYQDAEYCRRGGKEPLEP